VYAQKENWMMNRVAGANEEQPASRTALADADDRDGGHPLGWREALRIALVGLAAVAVAFHPWEPFPDVRVIGALGVLIGGWPIFREAVENVAARRMTMELSMSIAIVAAAAIAAFFTALIITLFVLLAEVLENMTLSRGRRAIRGLLDFLPRSVIVRRANGVGEVSVDELRPGELVLVNPGGLAPVDGVVVGGHSFVDQARITGEPMPVEVAPGSVVYAGTINQSGALEIRTERIGRDTSYGKIIEAVESAERSRAPIQRLADRLAGYLVYLALAAAAVTFVATRDIRSTISVVIVAGACGIAAGTPLAILGGIGRAARLGAIIKGGLYLETLGRVDTVVFDKTGTLTFGRPAVQAVIPAGAASEDEVLDAAGTAELRSEHPLGKAIVAYAVTRGRALKEPEEFAYTPGLGIAALSDGVRIFVGKRELLASHRVDAPPNSASIASASTEVMVASGGRFLGTVLVADAVRPEARPAIEALSRMGICGVLLTGDMRGAAEAVAQRLGIAEFAAGLLPQAKLKRIKELTADGRVVAMLGDGINDAPALAAASVGVAMGSGTDVARESANIVLLGNDLGKFAETVRIARSARRIIWQNFVGTIVIDLAGIALAGAGMLGPAQAALVHVASEMAFILNSARMLPRGGSRGANVETAREPEAKTLSNAA
jgi:Cu+-exporting ATPase